MKTSRLFLIAALLGVIFFTPGSAKAFNSVDIQKLSGRILLQVQAHGEAWYIRPGDLLRYYMRDGAVAYEMMRFFGQGIADANLAKIPKVSTTDEMKQSPSACVPYSLGYRFRGQILLQVQAHGEAWYIDPTKCRAIYMADGAAAYQIMRYLGLGITDSDLSKIKMGQTIYFITEDDSGLPPAEPIAGPAQKASSTAIQYSLAQAMSDSAQLSTISFSGLAFITGSAGADTFFPPGKVADFFGFQYMRDIDTAGYGHNSAFLTRAANNVLYILNDGQRAKLVALAKEQAPLYVNFAYNRFLLTNAFRRNLEGKIPAGSNGLATSTVSAYAGALYKTDAELSYDRALAAGEIINSFTDDQKAYLAKMQFNNYSSWPDVAENEAIKKSLSNNEYVALMTYASELFSWYKGGLDADIYFCPERHGTYFGGFYLKDYPAMGNNDYFIDTALNGDLGKGFLDILNSEQKALITGIIDKQRPALAEIARLRTAVAAELRQAMAGKTMDKNLVYSSIERYGQLDGQLSALYAARFAAVNKTLTATQRAALVKLRNLSVVPSGAYRFSTPVAMPQLASTDFLFGAGSAPVTVGQTTPPDSFGN